MTTTDLGSVARQWRTASLLLLPVPLLAVLIATISWGAPDGTLLTLGAAGWLLALLLRQPVVLIASRLTSPERTRTIVGWASGPAEELVRVVMVVVFVTSVPNAIWAGVGWAGVEVILIVINGFVIANLLGRNDPKALKVQALLRERDMSDTHGPIWAVLERCSAIALHVGFTLLLFAQPWWAAATLILHSSANMLAVHCAKRSVVITEIVLGGFSLGVLLCGLSANGVW